MASIEKKDNGKYRVRWHERRVRLDADGVERRDWKDREKTCPDRATAVTLKREIERAAALGENWSGRREQAVVTVGRIALDYIAAAIRDPATPEATTKFRATMLGALLRWAGEERPVSDLSVGFLRDYADSLPGEGRKAVTRHRKVQEAEHVWDWAYDDADRYPGVPVPRRITDKRKPGAVRQPVPVVVLDYATWADMDAMIGCLGTKAPWHRRLAVLLRYTGLRASQALGLRWADVALDRGVLRVRAGATGAKRGMGRALPMHPGLVDEMAGWGQRSGMVFRAPDGQPAMPGGRATEPFRKAWGRAGVDPAKWDKAPDPELPGARANARPTHTLHGSFKAELEAGGVPNERAAYLTGHKRGATIAAYIPEGRPESVPLWKKLVEDMVTVPRIAKASTGKVVALRDGVAPTQVAPIVAGRPRTPRGRSLHARAVQAVMDIEPDKLD
jgi:integrase